MKWNSNSLRWAAYSSVVTLAIFIASSCGKSSSDITSTDVDPVAIVNGSAMFADQCPYGSQTEPRAAQVQIWENRGNDIYAGCSGLQNMTVKLAQSLPTLTLMVDCTKKNIVVRNKDLGLDHNWEMLPSGHFDFDETATTKNGERTEPFQGVAVLASDGAGHLNCSMPIDLNVSGDIDCKDRDKVSYKVDTIWRPADKKDLRWATISNPCTVPTSCYFYAGASINQCS